MRVHIVNGLTVDLSPAQPRALRWINEVPGKRPWRSSRGPLLDGAPPKRTMMALMEMGLIYSYQDMFTGDFVAKPSGIGRDASAAAERHLAMRRAA